MIEIAARDRASVLPGPAPSVARVEHVAAHGDGWHRSAVRDRMRLGLRAAWRSMLDVAVPRVCVCCDRAIERGSSELACGRCWAGLPRLAHPQCARCGHPLTVGDVPPPADRGPRRCRWCDLLPPYVRAARSVCWVPDGVGGQIVHALKYDGWHALGAGIARRLAMLDWPADVVAERAAVAPVPLAPVRRRERGYNQSERIAAALARTWDVPTYPHALVRARATVSQTRLTPGERLRNVAGAFRADEQVVRALRGAHVVLVDDVVTTAATLNACAAALIAGGVRVVSYVTFGRARS